jgi:2-polyprenyl-6-hydroxyphenyl methylase/3-demethylubiquinone-9 3-methyltransferase
MPVDNEVYDREGDTWRDERCHLSLLGPLASLRVAYMRRVLSESLHLDPAGKQVLDVGCGGGLVAEKMAQLGWRVTGIDPAAGSIHYAQAHARQAGLPIEYRTGSGEALPFEDASFDVVYSLDVLEHVTDLDQVITEVARVLRPRGVFIYDTVNRTLFTKLVAIKIMQEWSWTGLMPPHFHDWRMFIKPAEMQALLRRHGLASCEVVGFSLRANPLAMLWLLHRRKRGRVSFMAVGQYVVDHVQIDRNTIGSYGGYALKTAETPWPT